MADGKWYFEVGDVLAIGVDLDPGQTIAFRNPVNITGNSFSITLSTPIDDEAIADIIRLLRKVRDET